MTNNWTLLATLTLTLTLGACTDFEDDYVHPEDDPIVEPSEDDFEANRLSATRALVRDGKLRSVNANLSYQGLHKECTDWRISFNLRVDYRAYRDRLSIQQVVLKNWRSAPISIDWASLDYFDRGTARTQPNRIGLRKKGYVRDPGTGGAAGGSGRVETNRDAFVDVVAYVSDGGPAACGNGFTLFLD